jgi:hypothetical protein
MAEMMSTQPLRPPVQRREAQHPPIAFRLRSWTTSWHVQRSTACGWAGATAPPRDSSDAAEAESRAKGHRARAWRRSVFLRGLGDNRGWVTTRGTGATGWSGYAPLTIRHAERRGRSALLGSLDHLAHLGRGLVDLLGPPSPLALSTEDRRAEPVAQRSTSNAGGERAGADLQVFDVQPAQ